MVTVNSDFQDGGTVDVFGATFPVCVIPQGNYVDDVSLPNNHVFVINGTVTFGTGDEELMGGMPSDSATLTIAAGTQVYAAAEEKSFAQRATTVSVGTFQNADEALVLGVEFGGRFEFGNFVDWFNAPEFFDSIYFIGNVAFLSSTVQLSDQGVNTELERPLEGQADYVLNAQLGYSDENIDLTVAYNQIGTRLRRAGVFGAENVFRQPQPRLDVTFKWRIWDGGTLTLKGSNLTNPTIEYLQQGEVWRSFTRGFSLGAGFRIDFL